MTDNEKKCLIEEPYQLLREDKDQGAAQSLEERSMRLKSDSERKQAAKEGKMPIMLHYVR